MNVRHSRLARLVALTVVVSMPVLGMAGIASAAAKGSAKWCANHPKQQNKPVCANSSGSGGGTGGPTNTDITVTASPKWMSGTTSSGTGMTSRRGLFSERWQRASAFSVDEVPAGSSAPV